MSVQHLRFSIFDWTHRESDDPYDQDPLGTCEATLAEVVARGGDGQVVLLSSSTNKNAKPNKKDRVAKLIIYVL